MKLRPPARAARGRAVRPGSRRAPRATIPPSTGRAHARPIASSRSTVTGGEPSRLLGGHLRSRARRTASGPRRARSSVDTSRPLRGTQTWAMRPPMSALRPTAVLRIEPSARDERSCVELGHRPALALVAARAARSRAQPRSTQASFQPMSNPSRIAVLRPVPPRGVTRCAASPIRNASPSRNRSASPTPNATGIARSISTGRPGSPAASRIHCASWSCDSASTSPAAPSRSMPNTQRSACRRDEAPAPSPRK